MANFRVQVANHTAVSLPKDYAVNTLYFVGDDPGGPAWTTFLTSLAAAWVLVTNLANKNFTIKAYDMADPIPRPVKAMVTQAGTDHISGPGEVACCLSYYATRNLPRRRGRIYMGPIQGAETSTPNPDGAFINSIIACGVAIDTAASVAGLVWSVRSEKDNAYFPITNLWVDNAWDTIRKRGYDSTARVTRTL